MKFAEFLHKFLFWADPLDSTTSGRAVPANISVNNTTRGKSSVTPRATTRKMPFLQEVEEQLLKPLSGRKGVIKKLPQGPSGSSRAARSRRYRLNKAMESRKPGVNQLKTMAVDKGNRTGRIPVKKSKPDQVKPSGSHPVKTPAALRAIKGKQAPRNGTNSESIKRANLKSGSGKERLSLMQALNYTTTTHKNFKDSTSRQKKAWRQSAQRESSRTHDNKKRILSLVTKARKGVPSSNIISKKERLSEKVNVTLKTVFKIATGASIIRSSLTVASLGGLVQFYLISNVDLVGATSEWEHLTVMRLVEATLNNKPILAYIGYMHLLLAVQARESKFGLMRLSNWVYANMSNALCVYEIHQLNAALLEYIDSNIEVIAHLWCELSVLHGMRFFGLRAVRPAISKAAFSIPNLLLEVLQLFPPVRAAKMLYDAYVNIPPAVSEAYRTHKMVASLYDPRVNTKVETVSLLDPPQALLNDVATNLTVGQSSIIIYDNGPTVSLILSPGILPGVSSAVPLSQIHDLPRLQPQAHAAIAGLSLVTGIFASAAAAAVVTPLATVGTAALPVHNFTRSIYESYDRGKIVNAQNYTQFFTFLSTTLVTGMYSCQFCLNVVNATRGFTFTSALNNHLLTCVKFAEQKAKQDRNQSIRGVVQDPEPLNRDSATASQNRNSLSDRFGPSNGPIITELFSDSD